MRGTHQEGLTRQDQERHTPEAGQDHEGRTRQDTGDPHRTQWQPGVHQREPEPQGRVAAQPGHRWSCCPSQASQGSEGASHSTGWDRATVSSSFMALDLVLGLYVWYRYLTNYPVYSIIFFGSKHNFSHSFLFLFQARRVKCMSPSGSRCALIPECGVCCERRGSGLEGRPA